MPIEFRIWRIDKGLAPIASSPMDNESRLEELLEQDLTILGLDLLLLVGRQVITAYGKRVDLVAINAEGHLFAIELKKGRTPREVVAQAIDYGFWVRDLATDDVIELFERYNEGTSFDEAFRNRFDQEPPGTLNEEHQLIIVASELDPATERIVSYISEYGVPVNVVFFQHFQDGDREYLARSWLIDPVEVEERATRSARLGRRSRAAWNGQDFFVSFGDGEDYNSRRSWEDAIRYGFVSAGGRRWFSRTLSMLFPGARVFVHIPQHGYVGVGTVTESVQPVSDFKVDIDGRMVPILEAPLIAKNMGRAADDPDRAEYVVRVDWDVTVPKDDAFWERGMYANQNSATRMRDEFTLERLVERFNLDPHAGG